jgi:hypothetical protein
MEHGKNVPVGLIFDHGRAFVYRKHLNVIETKTPSTICAATGKLGHSKLAILLGVLETGAVFGVVRKVAGRDVMSCPGDFSSASSRY